MTYHDRFAHTDERRCGYTSNEMGKDIPPAGNDFLSNREVEAVVKYLLAKQSGAARPLMRTASISGEGHGNAT